MSKPLAALAALLLLGGGVVAITLGGGALRSKVEPAAVHDAMATPAPPAAERTDLRLRTATTSPEAVGLTEASPTLRARTEAPSKISPHSHATGALQPESLAAPPPAASAAAPAEATTMPHSKARTVAPVEILEPTTQSASLERVEPRAALSEIGQALPPKPKMPNDWKGTTLFNPVATAAGTLEAKGYSIAVAGVEPLPPEEACDSGGKSWPCGMRARAAFRSWLRGRSVICDIPPEADRETIVVQCRVGKKDAAEWLIENGWARAASDGPYAGQQDAATKAKRGIFGAPPATTAASSSNAESALPAPAASDTAILSGPVEEAQPDDAVAPQLLTGPLEFPDAPTARAGEAPQ